MKNDVKTAIVEVSKIFTNTSQLIFAILDVFEYSDDEDSETVNNVGLPVCVSSITRGSSIIRHTDATHNSTQSVSSLSTQGNNDSIDLKLFEYMKRRPVSRSMSPFYCWTKLRNEVMPNTYSMALLTLLIPATTVAVEISFSLTGQMVTPRRSRMLPNALACRECVSAWTKANKQMACTHIIAKEQVEKNKLKPSPPPSAIG
jgi:hAT family C-terminal dimerisation region